MTLSTAHRTPKERGPDTRSGSRAGAAVSSQRAGMPRVPKPPNSLPAATPQHPHCWPRRGRKREREAPPGADGTKPAPGDVSELGAGHGRDGTGNREYGAGKAVRPLSLTAVCPSGCTSTKVHQFRVPFILLPPGVAARTPNLRPEVRRLLGRRARNCPLV